MQIIVYNSEVHCPLKARPVQMITDLITTCQKKTQVNDNATSIETVWSARHFTWLFTARISAYIYNSSMLGRHRSQTLRKFLHHQNRTSETAYCEFKASGLKPAVLKHTVSPGPTLMDIKLHVIQK